MEGPPDNTLILDPLAVQHLDKRLFIIIFVKQNLHPKSTFVVVFETVFGVAGVVIRIFSRKELNLICRGEYLRGKCPGPTANCTSLEGLSKLN